ncbi:hypothetical protein OAV46_00745 [Euryarchaeota archaeon]|nr:hypothetical protein [Euryarchaeota archaeon]
MRLDLASISRTRSIDIPRLPGGIVLWGGAACYLGVTILIPPLGYAVTLLGAGSMLSHFIFKNPALVIETNIGDRHIIQSKLHDHETLLKLQMMIQKVSNGQTVSEAKASLEKEFQRVPNPVVKPKRLLSAPNIESLAIDYSNEIQPSQNYLEPQVNINKVQPKIDILPFNFQEPTIEPDINSEFSNPNNEYISHETTSAYQQTWGRNEPEWYNEKQAENRIDSVLEDATIAMDSNIFGFGGIFDSEPAPSSVTEPVNYSAPPEQQPSYPIPEQYISQQNNQIESTNSIFGINNNEIDMQNRPISSAGMIRAANGLRRSPINNHQNNLPLPEPTDEAVRGECRPGLVKRAKAQQSLQRKAEIMASLPAPADLQEFPGLLNLANSLGDGRLVLRNQPVKRRKLGLLERLLVPSSRNYVSSKTGYAAEYGDPDGINADKNSRFQTSQSLRIRSDQEHQADVKNRITQSTYTERSSAVDEVYRVVEKVANGEEHSPVVLINEEPMLRFNQMRRTSNQEDPGHLKGIRRLD